MPRGLLYGLRPFMETPEKTAEDNAPPATETAGPTGASQDFVLSLNFVPNWARQGASENPYANHAGEERRDESSRGERREFRQGGRDSRGPRRDGPRGPRPGGGGGPRDQRREGGPRKFDGGRPQDRRGDQSGPRGRGPRRDRDFVPRLPLNISFVPEKNHLGVVASEIREKHRAYPLAMVAGLFLQKPENHQIKFEVQSGKDRPAELRLWQNQKTGMVFLKRETAQSFAVGHDLEEFFEKQEQQVEPPTGNFVCVGRCTISGELLGPPNFHGYQEKLMELHRTRFSGMPLDVYRSRIEVVRDPALVEQWKEQSRTIRRYREKTDAGGEAKLKRSEAEFRFLEKYAKDLFRQGQRFLMPGARANDLPDPELRRLVREAWTRESKFPMTLLFALRAAFKHMKLELFKVGNETFVTAVAPKPLDTEHVVENIQKMIDLLREHPGWTRKELVEHMQPGLAAESPEAVELLSPLRWLVDKGHVIEFFNGTLSLPAKPAPRSQPAEKTAEPAASAVAKDAPPPAEADALVVAAAEENAPPPPSEPVSQPPVAETSEEPAAAPEVAPTVQETSAPAAP